MSDRIGAGLDIHPRRPPRIGGVQLRTEAELLLEKVQIDAGIDDRDGNSLAIQTAGMQCRDVEPCGDVGGGPDRIVIEARQIGIDPGIGEYGIAVDVFGHGVAGLNIDRAAHREMTIIVVDIKTQCLAAPCQRPPDQQGVIRQGRA